MGMHEVVEQDPKAIRKAEEEKLAQRVAEESGPVTTRKPTPVECIKWGLPLEMAQQGIPDDLTKEIAAELIAKGVKLADIGKLYGLQGNTLYNLLQNRWKLRKAQGVPEYPWTAIVTKKGEPMQEEQHPWQGEHVKVIDKIQVVSVGLTDDGFGVSGTIEAHHHEPEEIDDMIGGRAKLGDYESEATPEIHDCVTCGHITGDPLCCNMPEKDRQDCIDVDYIGWIPQVSIDQAIGAGKTESAVASLIASGEIRVATAERSAPSKETIEYLDKLEQALSPAEETPISDAVTQAVASIRGKTTFVQGVGVPKIIAALIEELPPIGELWDEFYKELWTNMMLAALDYYYQASSEVKAGVAS